jgi:hypothetical protein
MRAKVTDRSVAVRAALGADPAREVVTRLVASADEWEAQADEMLLSEGHVAAQGFVVLSGTATLAVDGITVARLGPGSAVWPAESPSRPMAASVVADGHMWLLLVPPADLAALRGSR